MKITEIHHPEQRQGLRDLEFVRVEKEMLEWEEYFEELYRNQQKPAKIVVNLELEEPKYDRIEDLPF